MDDMRAYFLCWLLLVISIHHACGQEPLPIMQLYEPEPNNIISNSGCKDGLLNDVDFFTVRGKVNKNGSSADAYRDTNLYLTAVADPSTNMWASQCRIDLTVCGSNLTTDCYCESKDANGDYHIVMTIIAKSIYSGGKLMLEWSDARSPHNQPMLSNQVDYFLGIIISGIACGQEPLPIMQLYEPEPNNIISNSGCKDGLLNDVDFFTVRGKVNKNGSSADAYRDTNLYLTAVADPSTNMWASQCRPDLTVCGSNLNTDCYCESKDANGDYHIVMTIMAKSIYSGGKLMLEWRDARSPYYPPILSNQVDYYLGIIISGIACGQEPLPIMQLYEPEPNNIISNSGCKDGLLNDVDFFTVRGKVNKNGSNPDAHRDTNLYFQAVADPSTNMWASQCRPDLTVCASNLNTDCYCESKDGNGDYHIVMTIMAKSIYSGGKLMLSWTDARNPFNPPILSNQVDYYPGSIISGIEPQREPPKISARSIQNGDILVEEDDVTVTCKVSGGYPSDQTVNLTCGQDLTSTSSGNSAELTLKEIELSYNETNCTCQATHVTGCYDVMSFLPLTVLKLPTQAPEHVQNRVFFVDYIHTVVSDHSEDSEIVIN